MRDRDSFLTYIQPIIGLHVTADRDTQVDTEGHAHTGSVLTHTRRQTVTASLCPSVFLVHSATLCYLVVIVVDIHTVKTSKNCIHKLYKE
jgi:hypothetical protein